MSQWEDSLRTVVHMCVISCSGDEPVAGQQRSLGEAVGQLLPELHVGHHGDPQGSGPQGRGFWGAPHPHQGWPDLRSHSHTGRYDG